MAHRDQIRTQILVAASLMLLPLSYFAILNTQYMHNQSPWYPGLEIHNNKNAKQTLGRHYGPVSRADGI